MKAARTPAVGVKEGPNPNFEVKYKAGRRPISLGRALFRVLKETKELEKPLLKQQT
jgi:hypothetical protein